MSTILIAYFTWSGNSKRLAAYLQTLTGGRVFRIETREPYPRFYQMAMSRAAKEKHRDSRPELTALPEGLDGCGTVYLVYPNWWNSVPMAVCSFLESVPLEGKRLRPLCTSGGSGIECSVSKIRQLCPKAEVENGLLVLDGTLDDTDVRERIEAWVNQTEKTEKNC